MAGYGPRVGTLKRGFFFFSGPLRHGPGGIARSGQGPDLEKTGKIVDFEKSTIFCRFKNRHFCRFFRFDFSKIGLKMKVFRPSASWLADLKVGCSPRAGLNRRPGPCLRSQFRLLKGAEFCKKLFCKFFAIFFFAIFLQIFANFFCKFCNFLQIFYKNLVDFLSQKSTKIDKKVDFCRGPRAPKRGQISVKFEDCLSI